MCYIAPVEIERRIGEAYRFGDAWRTPIEPWCDEYADSYEIRESSLHKVIVTRYFLRRVKKSNMGMEWEEWERETDCGNERTQTIALTDTAVRAIAKWAGEKQP